jgi:hypothetical protein
VGTVSEPLGKVPRRGWLPERYVESRAGALLLFSSAVALTCTALWVCAWQTLLFTVEEYSLLDVLQHTMKQKNPVDLETPWESLGLLVEH